MAEESIWILVPIFALLIAGLAIYLKYKKEMAMVSKGLHPHKKSRKEDELTSGLIMIGIGIALYFGFLYGFGGFGAYMIAPLILIFVGFALLLSYLAKRKISKKPVKKRVKRKKKRKKR
ncbi:hypothetical protein CL616_05075 [archaeon]|nr:hypothetical protein [archaeon]|tara:strand:- start:150 stop:506 length:357 start_codon:yes stop_codon:yes gene_type:complete